MDNSNIYNHIPFANIYICGQNKLTFLKIVYQINLNNNNNKKKVVKFGLFFKYWEFIEVVKSLYTYNDIFLEDNQN